MHKHGTSPKRTNVVSNPGRTACVSVSMRYDSPKLSEVREAKVLGEHFILPELKIPQIIRIDRSNRRVIVWPQSEIHPSPEGAVIVPAVNPVLVVVKRDCPVL